MTDGEMTSQNLTVVLAERPKGEIVPGKTLQLKAEPVPTEEDLKDGQFLLETLYLSVDPAMRGMMDDARSYTRPVGVGEVMRGAAIARVVATKTSRVKPGDILVAFTGWREYAIIDEHLENQGFFSGPFDLAPGTRVTDLLGVLGSTGLTAYFGLTKVGQPKEGETVVVSGAAGATGSVVCQIAKNAGARVVATAGSDDKVRWLKDELGLDVALNYKDPDFKQKFKDATPDYIDVFWDNVGGDVLEMALGRAANFARFVMCGAISQYNAVEKKGPRNIGNVVRNRIRMQGILVLDWVPEYGEARKALGQWLSEGKIKRRQHIVKGGLKAADRAFIELFEGANTGKLLLEVRGLEEESKL